MYTLVYPDIIKYIYTYVIVCIWNDGWDNARDHGCFYGTVWDCAHPQLISKYPRTNHQPTGVVCD